MPQSKIAPPALAFADLVYATKDIGELEDALSNVVAPQSLSPMTRAGTFDGSFIFHGRHGLGVFDLRFGRRLSSNFPPKWRMTG